MLKIYPEIGRYGKLFGIVAVLTFLDAHVGAFFSGGLDKSVILIVVNPQSKALGKCRIILMRKGNSVLPFLIKGHTAFVGSLFHHDMLGIGNGHFICIEFFIIFAFKVNFIDNRILNVSHGKCSGCKCCTFLRPPDRHGIGGLESKLFLTLIAENCTFSACLRRFAEYFRIVSVFDHS